MIKGLGSLSILMFIFLSGSLIAQEKNYQKTFSLSYESGPMLSNGTDWGDEVKNAIDYRAIDLQIGWKKNYNSKFNYLYRYPTLGVGFNSAISNYAQIGRPSAVYGFMEVPFSIRGQRNRVSFGYFLQFGVGFNFTPYDPDTNPVNQYIGSKVNCYIQMGFNSLVKVSDRIDLQASVGHKHFSNGSTKKPNAGINLFPLNVGLNVKLGELKPIPADVPELGEKSLKTFWNLALYTGMKNYDIGDPAYFRSGLGINYLIEPTYKYRMGIGLDLFWAQGMNQRFPGENFSFKDQTSLAVVGSWEWRLTERLFVPIGLGAYLYRNELNQEITWFYERIGVRYRFDNHLSAGMQIKAHKAKADFFEFTLGYTIQGK